MPKVSVGDADIYFETHGAGSPVLLVPGLGGVGAYWTPNLEAFSRRHQTVIHDHRGTGQSSRSEIRYSVEQMTSDLIAVMDHLGLAKVHLVGHSTGGAIGQTLAATHPERLASLVIYASWTKADPFFRRVFEARRALLTEAGTNAYIRSTAVFLYPDWWINQNITTLEDREAKLAPVFPSANIVASRIDAIVDFDRTHDLAQIGVPTLVICAKDDILTPPYFSRDLARAIPGAELVLLERGGHCASEVCSDAFNAAVLSFISQNEGDFAPR
jgi:aminoacrylate hydrolase